MFVQSSKCSPHNKAWEWILTDYWTDSAILTSPRTFVDKRWIGPVKLLCIIMFNVSKIRPKSLLGPVKAQKFSWCVCLRMKVGRWELMWHFISNGNLRQYVIHQYPYALQWRHNGRNGISNHQPHDCLLNRLFRLRSNKTSKLCITGFC